MLIFVDEAIIFEGKALLLEDTADVRAELRQRQPADIVGAADHARLLEPAAARVDLVAGFAIALLSPAGHAGAEGAEGDQRKGGESGQLGPDIQERERARGRAEAILHGVAKRRQEDQYRQNQRADYPPDQAGHEAV